ncbi:MAG: hypothetical protein KJP00_06820 [Bacteroidia bacterium]|nr:hypothetical protein [Bacteroidia bacterium]
MKEEIDFQSLVDYIQQIPPVEGEVSVENNDGFWKIEFRMDIHHNLAWRALQELANVVNYLSAGERLPSRLYPISPAPYFHEGPGDTLRWIIENTDKEFKPNDLLEWLEGRLPNPVDDLTLWDEEE